jgi:hypothetical protein
VQRSCGSFAPALELMFGPMDLHVEVLGNEITITTAAVGTAYSVTYEKRPDEPRLVMTHSWLADHDANGSGVPR